MTLTTAILIAIENSLTSMTPTGYSYDKVTYWQDTDTQYEGNHLDYRDTTAEYKKDNRNYCVNLEITLQAILFETPSTPAPVLGTLAIDDLILAVNRLELPVRSFAEVKRTNKWVETKGKTASHIEVELAVTYKFFV